MAKWAPLASEAITLSIVGIRIEPAIEGVDDVSAKQVSGEIAKLFLRCSEPMCCFNQGLF